MYVFPTSQRTTVPERMRLLASSLVSLTSGAGWFGQFIIGTCGKYNVISSVYVGRDLHGQFADFRNVAEISLPNPKSAPRRL